MPWWVGGPLINREYQREYEILLSRPLTLIRSDGMIRG